MKNATLLVAILVISVRWLLAAPPVGPQIALLNSDINTKNYFALHYAYCDPDSDNANALGGWEFRRYFLGWRFVLEHELNLIQGTGYNVIHDSDVTASGLAPYRVLILANNASLSEDQTKVIREWVIRGGRLLATFGSGYKGVLTDPRQADLLKLQEGGTGGLHQLWHDPLSMVVTTQALAQSLRHVTNPSNANNPDYGGAVEVMITRPAGPTDPSAVPTVPSLSGARFLLKYGSNGNVLIQRPENNPGVYGFLIFKNNLDQFGLNIYEPGNAVNPNNDINWKRPIPAILANRAGKGLVVYYAFAPELLVSLEFDLAGHCSGEAADANCTNLKYMCTTDANYAYLNPSALSPGDSPNAGPAPTPANNLFFNRSTELRPLMKQTVLYLLNSP
ncbi:MAG: hypothetical protein HYX72_05255 [Acidobacteria bacterium]|nr:hypothetical protein [Acidobacteriota bacterium]